MTLMDRWVEAATAELGLDQTAIDVPVVLDLARDVARSVLRPGAPVSAYLLGLAVGRGADPAEAAGRLAVLALAWPSTAETAQTDETAQSAETA